jgi:hypothetical protein
VLGQEQASLTLHRGLITGSGIADPVEILTTTAEVQNDAVVIAAVDPRSGLRESSVTPLAVAAAVDCSFTNQYGCVLLGGLIAGASLLVCTGSLGLGCGVAFLTAGVIVSLRGSADR